MKHYVILLVVALVVLLGVFLYQYIYYGDKKIHVLFCYVGGGSVILLRTPSGRQWLFGGGHDDSALRCLDKHILFWERRIDLMVLDRDFPRNSSGLIYVVKRYITRYFVVYNSSFLKEFQGLSQLLDERHVIRKVMQEGAVIRARDDVVLQFLPVGMLVQFGHFSVLLMSKTSDHRNYGSVTILEAVGSRDLAKVNLKQLLPEWIVVSSEGNSVYTYRRKRILLRSGEDVAFVSDGKQWQMVKE